MRYAESKERTPKICVTTPFVCSVLDSEERHIPQIEFLDFAKC
jgi:hypothetical protein